MSNKSNNQGRAYEFSYLITLFEPIYDFAGKVRTINIAKGNFRFAPLMYLQAALQNIEKMPQSTYGVEPDILETILKF